jgi:uncharacterized protein YjbI with pentapeptide repeats
MEIKVFISSKMMELRDVREVVGAALKERGIEAFVYEEKAGARPGTVVETSLEEVEKADVYVGLFWQKYGPVTVEEFRHARQHRKPCLIYIRDKDIQREKALEDFLQDEVYDLDKGVTYDYFDSAVKLGEQVADDIMAWLVRRHREMTAEIQEARVSRDEIARLQAEVDRLQAASREPLPQGTAADYLAQQMRAWFETLGYRFESHDVRDEEYFEWIINVPARRGYDRILVRGIEGEAEVSDVAALRQVVDEQDTDEGWLVAARRKSQAACIEVEKRENCDLFCYTFDELLDERADFSGYLDWLEEEVKRRGIDTMYVPLACTKEEFDPETGQKIGESRYDARSGWIDGYIDRWLDDPAKEHISILGEFGTGKTWFAFHYAWTTLQRYREAKERGIERPRLPLVVPLRDYAKAVSVESLFSEFFFRKHEIPLPGYSAFEQLNRMGKLLLIFDGFDEMAAKVDRQKMINNFWELAQVVVSGSKAILTCRTEHFPEAQEGRALLSAELQASTAKLTGEPPQFEVLELEKFDDDQIRQVLSFRARSKTVKQVMDNPQLLDLARRPIMTEFILEALPDIEAGKPVDLSRVYMYAVRRKMERDIKAERTFTSLADKLYFLCELSWEMLSTDQMSLNYRLFPDRLRQLFGHVVQEQKDLDHWHYDMMGQTMLIRNADGDYTPAHRSLLEFFVAYKFAAQMGALASDFTELAQAQSHLDTSVAPQNYTWSSYFQRKVNEAGAIIRIPPLKIFARESFEEMATTVGKQPLPSAIMTLLEGMGVLKPLYELVEATCNQDPDIVLYSGGNAATLVQRLGGTLERAQLAGANLSGACLDNCDLEHANFQSAILREVHLEGARLNGADFSGSDLRGAYIRHCWAKGTKLDGILVDRGIIWVFVGSWAEFLPTGSTLLDAAFRIHTEVGRHCLGGTIDGKSAEIHEILSSGSQVWIETDPDKYTVTPDWLSFVVTSSARYRIARHLRHLLANAEGLLMAELKTICKTDEFRRLSDKDLWQVLLVATISDQDEKYSRYQETVDSRTSRRDVALEMNACLVRYNQLMEELVKAKTTPNKPRTHRRLQNLLDRPILLYEFKADSVNALILRVLKGEVAPSKVAETLAMILTRGWVQHPPTWLGTSHP